MTDKENTNKTNLTQNVATGVAQDLMVDAVVSAVVPAAGSMINLMRKFSTAKKAVKTVGKTALMETAKTVTQDEEKPTAAEEIGIRVLTNIRSR